MESKVVSIPVTIEQIAAVVRHMRPEDRQRLLELTPELWEELPKRPSRTLSQARAAAEAMRRELRDGLESHPLSPEEPFLGDLTLGDYLALPDRERACLWDEWAEEDVTSWKEVDVLPDAMPAG